MTPQHFIAVIKRRALIVWCIIAVGLALMVALRDKVPNTYVGLSHVVLVADSAADRDPAVGIVDLPQIAASSIVLERVRQQLKLPISLIDFKQSVGAAVVARTSIMAISYHDLSAERAIQVSNALADELARYYDEISTQRYDVDVDRLSAEMTNESGKIRNLNEQLGSIVARNPFVTSDQSINTLSTQLTTLAAQRATAYAQLQGDSAIAASLAPNRNLAAIARHEILTNDPTYVAVRALEATDSAQLANDEAGYTTSFPGLKGAKTKVARDNALASNVAANVLASRDAFSATQTGTVAQRVHQLAVVRGDAELVSQLDAQMAKERASLEDFPSSGKAYNSLKAQLDALQSEYTSLAQSRATALANRAEASSLGSVVVMDRAIKADTQLTGGRTRAAVLTLILVLAFAIGAALLVESLDPRIRRSEEIEQLYGMPVIARFGGKA